MDDSEREVWLVLADRLRAIRKAQEAKAAEEAEWALEFDAHDQATVVRR